MLKIVVFDCGFGGELFADQLEEKLDVVEIIRVIDWRNAEKFLEGRYKARALAEKSLRPYLEKVDLIIFANHLLSLTSLDYFKRKYPCQSFLGFSLPEPDTFLDRPTLILTTTQVARTLKYKKFIHSLKRQTMTLRLDSWTAKIDDGELTEIEVEESLKLYLKNENFLPKEIILAESNFSDLKPALKKLFNRIKIYDSFDETFRATCKTLKLRGGIGKKK